VTGNEVRSTFLRFFEERGHRVVRSSSLVPANDPTLLFTNAGMNQFKDVFLGLEQRDYRRATTCQKCVRAGGKHNDLENVGFTNRHHTFFEMLGNFSFGDYFKKDAIAFAMELVTGKNWYALASEKLYFTVFGGAELGGQKLPPDHDARDLWHQIGAPKDRVFEIPGLKDNFWQMGDTGPCGPCSEIFYDMGITASDQGHTDCNFPCDCGRYVEIWNLVFMQFNRTAEGSLNPLPKPSVDTGMGLERVTAVKQGVISNFDTDLFMPLIQKAATFCGVDVEVERKRPFQLRGSPEMRFGGKIPSLRIIADHSRAATFLISDGVVPSNEGRGYVLRKIIRRALVHVRFLEGKSPFLSRMAGVVVDEMRAAYPDLENNKGRITRVLDEEESRFNRTVVVGLSQLRSIIDEVKRESPRYLDYYRWKRPNDNPEDLYRRLMGLTGEKFANSSREEIDEMVARRAPEIAGPAFLKQFAEDLRKRRDLDGEAVFKLYDTYGLHRDLVEDFARDAGIDVDWSGFERAMQEQRTRAKASWKGAHKEAANPVYSKLAETFKTEPAFYFGTRVADCRVEAIVTKQGQVNEIKKGAEAEIVLDRTAIYSESGGQVADAGGLFDNSGSLELAEVRGAYYPVSGLIAHRIVAKEDIRVGDHLATVADAERRHRNMRNHTGTHLVHAALRGILGTHVHQAGSLVAPDHLRFDFSHFVAVDPSEIAEIEQQVNEEILRNLEIRTDIMNIDDALASGALAFFGDKYPEANVRVVTIDDASYPKGFYSKELCGGTHVSRTGEIGLFKILSESSTAAGIRRIEAISGDRALAEYQTALQTLRAAASLLNTSEAEVVSAIERQLEAAKDLEKQIANLKRKAAGSQAQDLLDGVKEVKGVKVLAAKVAGTDRDGLRQMVDTLRQKLGSGVVVLAAADDGKVALITGVTKDLIPRLHAGKIVQELAKLVGGSGGGRPDLAEAGGKDTSAVESALSTVYPLLERSL
jgi:alanyl-tRNA synthetase